jgi:hypothetical protein
MISPRSVRRVRSGPLSPPCSVTLRGDALARAAALGLDARRFFDDNDSYHPFEPLDALLKTGPTKAPSRQRPGFIDSPYIDGQDEIVLQRFPVHPVFPQTPPATSTDCRRDGQVARRHCGVSPQVIRPSFNDLM